MKLRLLLIPTLLYLAVPTNAANHFVRAGATNNGDGTSWSAAASPGAAGAFNAFPATLIRGDTYYFATATYPTLVLDDAVSGTLVITLKGATVADHGIETGWLSTYSVSGADGGAQAQFSTPTGGAAVTITTSYWVFDCSVGSMSAVSTDYGCLMKTPTDCSSGNSGVNVGLSGTTLTTVTVKHVAYFGCGDSFDAGQSGFGVGCGNCHVTLLTLLDNFGEGGNIWGNSTNMANSTIQRNFVSNFRNVPPNTNKGKEFFGINNCHFNDNASCQSGLCAQGQCTVNNVFRGNVFRSDTFAGNAMTGCITGLGPGNAVAILNALIDSNVFDGCNGNSGTIGGINGFVIQGTGIHNNTWVNITGRLFQQCDVGACTGASGNAFKNNLTYNSASVLQQSTGGPIEHDYQCWRSPVDTPPTETNGVTGTGDPFVNLSGGNYRLATNVCNARLNLTSLGITTDLYGVAFNTGDWSGGVAQFVLAVKLTVGRGRAVPR